MRRWIWKPWIRIDGGNLLVILLPILHWGIFVDFKRDGFWVQRKGIIHNLIH